MCTSTALAGERVVHDLPALEELAVPQVDQLLGEVRLHVIAEDLGQAREQRVLVGRGEELERLLVDVHHADLAHAAHDEIGMHVEEYAEVRDAERPHLVQAPFDAAEVLHPQRDRGVLEQAARIALAAHQPPACAGAFGHVLDGQQHAPP